MSVWWVLGLCRNKCWVGHKSEWRELCFLLEEDFEKMEHVIGGKFKLGRKIGSGSFGELYLGNCFCYHSCGFCCCCCHFVFFTTLCSLFWWQVSMCNLGRKWQLSWYVIYSFQGIYALLWVFTFQFSMAFVHIIHF